LLPHHPYAGARRNNGDHLLWQRMDHIGHPVRWISGIVFHPLTQHARQTRSNTVNRGAGPQTADHSEPRGNGLAEEYGAAGDERFLLNWDPDVRRIAPQRLAKKSRWCDAGDLERMSFDHKGGTHNRRIAAVDRLPEVMADHDDGRRSWVVVFGCKHA